MLADTQDASHSLGTILLLEDDAMVSSLLEDLILELGAERVLLCSDLAQARQLIDSTPIRCAILDVYVTGEDSYGVADALVAKGIPFFFVSASEPEAVPESHRHHMFLRKPFSGAELKRCLLQAIGAAPPGRTAW